MASSTTGSRMGGSTTSTQPLIYSHAIPPPKTLIAKKPKHVMLFRVSTRGDNKLVNRMQLLDVSNPGAPYDVKLANKALLLQETHVIHLPKILTLEDGNPHCWANVKIATQALSAKIAPPRGSPPGTAPIEHIWPASIRKDYYQPLHPFEDQVWRFRDLPRPFNGDTLVAYKISYFGVDIFTSTKYPRGGRNIVQMDLNVRCWADMNRKGHANPRFKYLDNKLQLNEQGPAPKGYEMFKGRVIYYPNKYPKGFAHGEGAGLQEPTGWSGWRLDLKEGQTAPDWYREEYMYYNPDDAMILRAMETSKKLTKWVNCDDVI